MFECSFQFYKGHTQVTLTPTLESPGWLTIWRD
jgi:hypothetical protein